ncbi:MAG TPA: tripartite tricarboxylate transporter permease [Devosia sp.]|nr:tripartite tricarboxylate transporter permease [Devosia sp.]
MESFIAAAAILTDPWVLAVILGSCALGLFVGSMPGLTAAMAIALLVPVTLYMEPIPALAMVVSVSCMAIFAGDIPSALLRIPGTLASAAYTDEAYAMSQKGEAELALGASVVFSGIGGIIGTLVLVFAAPELARIAIKFSSFEYFWLVCLGLSCAVMVGGGAVVKSLIALMLGLIAGMVGMDNPAAFPRFAFGNVNLNAGIELIAAMVGLFAVSETLRMVTSVDAQKRPILKPKGRILAGQWRLTKRYPLQWLSGSGIGVVIGALPGAGADIAAWVSYAVAKRFSRTPELFGKGHPEGLVSAGAANNAAVSGTWIPALIFGIPGDAITAIVIGILYLKGLNPGPLIFVQQPVEMMSLFIMFFAANILMIPLGVLAIKLSVHILRVPRLVLMPIILIFCIVGAYSITNNPFSILVMLCFGVVGFVMMENDFPVAPAILGIVLGPMLEQNFFNSMIKADGNFLGFLTRPVSLWLGLLTMAIWGWMIIAPLLRSRRRAKRQNG